jgi:hypothetical protein
MCWFHILNDDAATIARKNLYGLLNYGLVQQSLLHGPRKRAEIFNIVYCPAVCIAGLTLLGTLAVSAGLWTRVRALQFAVGSFELLAPYIEAICLTVKRSFFTSARTVCSGANFHT